MFPRNAGEYVGYEPRISNVVHIYQQGVCVPSVMWSAFQYCYGKVFLVNVFLFSKNLSYNVHFVTVRLIDSSVQAEKFTYCVSLHGAGGRILFVGR